MRESTSPISLPMPIADIDSSVVSITCFTSQDRIAGWLTVLSTQFALLADILSLPRHYVFLFINVAVAVSCCTSSLALPVYGDLQVFDPLSDTDIFKKVLLVQRILLVNLRLLFGLCLLCLLQARLKHFSISLGCIQKCSTTLSRATLSVILLFLLLIWRLSIALQKFTFLLTFSLDLSHEAFQLVCTTHDMLLLTLCLFDIVNVSSTHGACTAFSWGLSWHSFDQGHVYELCLVQLDVEWLPGLPTRLASELLLSVEFMDHFKRGFLWWLCVEERLWLCGYSWGWLDWQVWNRWRLALALRVTAVWWCHKFQLWIRP